MNREEFSVKFLEALGDSHEAEQLTDDLTKEFYQQFKDSGLDFEEWFESYGAPNCPNCSKRLVMIYPQQHGISYKWNRENRSYETEDAQEQKTFYCGECKKRIGGWRADGETWGYVPDVED